MTWRVVHIKNSERLTLKLDNLEIQKLGHTYMLALPDISIIILEGNMSITTNILAALTKHNIALVICDQKYMPTGLLLNYGQYHHSAKRALQQMKWSKKLKDTMWQVIVSQKILNQLSVAQQSNVSQNRMDMMTDFYLQIEQGDRTNREGQVAKVYFNSLYGNNFKREEDCFENVVMDYGYSILRAAIGRMTVGQGLMTMVGVFHKNEYNTFNLVDDLMEPFRPLMDYWIQQKILANFSYLTYEVRLTLIDFLNQPMMYKTVKSTVDQVMQKYLISFVKAMSEKKPELILQICLQDFMEAMK